MMTLRSGSSGERKAPVDTLKQNLGTVVAVAALIGVGLWIVAPGALAGVVPLLFVLACPLGMVFMMKAMGGMGRQNREDAEPAPTANPATSSAREQELAELRGELESLKSERPLGEGDGRPAP
jgi:hypothetical protein